LPFFFVPVTTLALASVEEHETASAAGLMNFIRTLSGAVATSIVTTGWENKTQHMHAELSGMVETSDEWIVERTGIRERRIAEPGHASERNTSLAQRAALQALEMAGKRPEDIDAGLIEAAQITYLEGYLFDPPRAQEAFRTAARIAHQAGRRVALSLSDPFCVDRHRAAFRELVMGEVDILFANEAEICSLYEISDFAQAAAAVRCQVEIAALTRSAHGSLVLSLGADGRGEAHVIAAAPVDHVADTTGAGDLYAAGFLFGLTHGLTLPDCGALGSLCAAEIISHVGARPETALRELVEAAGYV